MNVYLVLEKDYRAWCLEILTWHTMCGFLCASLCLESSYDIKKGTIYGSWFGYFDFIYVFTSLVTGFSYYGVGLS